MHPEHGPPARARARARFATSMKGRTAKGRTASERTASEGMARGRAARARRGAARRGVHGEPAAAATAGGLADVPGGDRVVVSLGHESR